MPEGLSLLQESNFLYERFFMEEDPRHMLSIVFDQPFIQHCASKLKVTQEVKECFLAFVSV